MRKKRKRSRDFLLAKIDITEGRSNWSVDERMGSFEASSGRSRLALEAKWRYPVTFCRSVGAGLLFGYIEPQFVSYLDEALKISQIMSTVEQLQKEDAEFLVGFIDEGEDQFFLARDFHCSLPLYLYFGEGNLVLGNQFSSVVNFLSESPELNEPILAAVLAGLPIASSQTIFSGLHILTEGAVVTADASRLTIDQRLPTDNHMSAATTFAELLEKAVTDRLRRVAQFVRVGVELSGGLDSSTVAGIVAAHCRQLPTFTVQFPGSMGKSQA